MGRHALLLFATSVFAQDWPQFLGPDRNGASPDAWNDKTSLGRVWKRSLGEGFSAPVVASGRLIVYHREGSQDKIESLDPATGKNQWTYAYTTGYRDDFGFSEGPRSTPAVSEGRVYAYSAEGLLHCVNLADGKKVWSLDARKEFGVRKEFFGTACSPLVDGSRVLMNIGGADGAGIVAIDKATGKTLWKALDHEAGYSSPTAATVGGERHALFFTRQGLVDADPASGRVRFQHRWRARMQASVNAATPLVSGSQVFITTSYDTGAALLDLRGGSPKVVWSGDDSISSHYATPVLHDGHLYGFHGRQETGQSLRCIEWATGKVRWNVDGMKAGTVTLAGNRLLVLAEGGELTVAPASPEGFKPIRKVRVADSVVRAYPALAGGRLFVRAEGSLASHRTD